MPTFPKCEIEGCDVSVSVLRVDILSFFKNEFI